MSLPIALGLVVAAGLAWQAEQAARAHRAAMDRVVRDHADFAAFLLYRVALDAVDRRALYGFNTLFRRAAGSPLPGPDSLGADRFEAERCLLPDGGRLYARWTAADGAVELSGSPDEATRSWLADTLPVLAGLPIGERIAHAFRPGGSEPAMLTYTVLRDTTLTPVAVYAANGCFTIDGESAFDIALRSTDVLPPSLTGGLPNEELLAMRVTTPAGDTIFASRPPWLDSAVVAAGSARPDSLGSGLTLHVLVRPTAAERLIVGGVPRSRLPQALLLLAVAGVLGVFAIIQAYRYLELVRLRERFMRDVSHELRTPLQQILLYTDLLRLEHIRDADQRRAALNTIETETRRLINMVNTVLRFTRPADLRPPVPTALRLAPAVREAVTGFEPLARGRAVSIHAQLDEEACAHVAPDAVRQILLNLLDNAVKFGPAGQTVIVRLETHDTRVVLCVDDEGPGIPLTERRAVFEAYSRLERVAREVPGTGIGLTIVQELVSRSGGTIEVDGLPGGGTRMRVGWPAARVAGEAATAGTGGGADAAHTVARE
jgi:signal transduction histidine kinase